MEIGSWACLGLWILVLGNCGDLPGFAYDYPPCLSWLIGSGNIFSNPGSQTKPPARRPSRLRSRALSRSSTRRRSRWRCAGRTSSAGNRRSAAPLESRSGNVAAEVERLVAYVELRHHGVERSGAADRVERPPLRDAALRRLERPKPVERPLPVNVTPTPGALFADIAVDRPEGSLTPHLSADRLVRVRCWRSLSIALVAVYVVSRAKVGGSGDDEGGRPLSAPPPNRSGLHTMRSQRRRIAPSAPSRKR